MNSFKYLKNNYPNVKLLFSIGGGTKTATDSFRGFAHSPSKRSSFAANILSYIRNNNLDGGK
jgi:GH18 family chitinase